MQDFQVLNNNNTGYVSSVADGVCTIKLLPDLRIGELVSFSSLTGLVVSIEGSDNVKALILGDETLVHEGDSVLGTSEFLNIDINLDILGSVIDPLGNHLIDRSKGVYDEYLAEENIELLNQTKKIDIKAPGILPRLSVKEPLYTGILAIDSMIPIGRGQRELIIGDRKTGKTAIALDTIINQNSAKDASSFVKCVYVATGQKKSSIALLVKTLLKYDSLKYSTVVVSSASDSANLQYLSVYSGCSIAEYWRDMGEHSLIIYDDLTKHAVSYRQISLLLRRSPGREAYPGDIFYAHSRLLERASKLNANYGAGSLTALPIIETQSNDVSAYIPTNVISITDGQIVLDNSLFNQGIRPAINVGLSVSRVGSSAQPAPVKQVAGSLKLELAQYREVLIFEKVSSDLDDITKLKLKRGKAIVNLLKQDQFSTLSVSSQVVLIYAGIKGLLDSFSSKQIEAFKLSIVNFVKENDLEFDLFSKLGGTEQILIENVISYVSENVIK